MQDLSRHYARYALAFALASMLLPSANAETPFLAVQRAAKKLLADESWADAAKLYGDFAEKHPSDSLAPVAAILQGILILGSENAPDDQKGTFQQADGARAAFRRAAQAPDTKLGQELRKIAHAWLARLQMEDLAVTLRGYYVEQVEYPEKLDTLVEAKLLSAEQLRDPWGKLFEYQATALRIDPKIVRQRYTLACSALSGGRRATKGIVKEALKFLTRYRLQLITPRPPFKAGIVRTDRRKEHLAVTEGMNVRGLVVLKVDSTMVILAEGEKLGVLTL